MDEHSSLASEWIAIVGSAEDPHQTRFTHSHVVTLSVHHEPIGPRRPGYQCSLCVETRLLTTRQLPKPTCGRSDSDMVSCGGIRLFGTAKNTTSPPGRGIPLAGRD